MHPRYVFTTAAIFSLIAFFPLRLHLRDLAEVVDTYSGFYPYLRRHPATLYRYSNNSMNAGPALVPPVMHHIFLAKGNPGASLSRYATELESCRELHPEWTSHVWNDTAAEDFMLQHYPSLFPHYKGYSQRIQRANTLRYALLHHYGGVYVDLDITCLQSLERLRTLPWLTPAAHPAGVNNAFILARPGHPLLGRILDEIPRRNMLWGLPYVENMLTTGCMFFSNMWMKHSRVLTRKSERGEPAVEGDAIYVLADEHGELGPHMLRGAVTTPLFRHGGASSWHGWDAAAFVLIGRLYGYILIVIGVLIIASVLLFSLVGPYGTRSWFRRSHRRHVSLGNIQRAVRQDVQRNDEEKQLATRRGSAEARSYFFAPRRSGSWPLARKE